MSIHCRFENCVWTGSQDEIFLHCEDNHRNRIIERRGEYRNFWSIPTSEFRGSHPFLLCTHNGLYWLAPGQHTADDIAIWGIFHIGDSEPISYRIHFGNLINGHCEYFGPLTSRSVEEERHDLIFAFDYLAYMEVNVVANQALIYIGDYNDDDDNAYQPTSDDLEFDENDERLNKLCVENFKCVVCYEFIKRNVRFCENKHFVCRRCFDGIRRHGRARCPVCRVDYSYDCASRNLERFLRMVKFPESNDTDDPVQVPKRQKKETAEEAQSAVEA